jgi:hypothetical protein
VKHHTKRKHVLKTFQNIEIFKICVDSPKKGRETRACWGKKRSLSEERKRL